MNSLHCITTTIYVDGQGIVEPYDAASIADRRIYYSQWNRIQHMQTQVNYAITTGKFANQREGIN